MASGPYTVRCIETSPCEQGKPLFLSVVDFEEGIQDMTKPWRCPICDGFAEYIPRRTKRMTYNNKRAKEIKKLLGS